MCRPSGFLQSSVQPWDGIQSFRTQPALIYSLVLLWDRIWWITASKFMATTAIAARQICFTRACPFYLKPLGIAAAREWGWSLSEPIFSHHVSNQNISQQLWSLFLFPMHQATTPAFGATSEPGGQRPHCLVGMFSNVVNDWVWMHLDVQLWLIGAYRGILKTSRFPGRIRAFFATVSILDSTDWNMNHIQICWHKHRVISHVRRLGYGQPKGHWFAATFFELFHVLSQHRDNLRRNEHLGPEHRREQRRFQYMEGHLKTYRKWDSNHLHSLQTLTIVSW